MEIQARACCRQRECLPLPGRTMKHCPRGADKWTQAEHSQHETVHPHGIHASPSDRCCLRRPLRYEDVLANKCTKGSLKSFVAQFGSHILYAD